MQDFWVVQHSWLIPLLPLIAAAIAGFFGAKLLKGQSHWPIWLGVGTSAIFAFILLFQTLLLPSHEGAAKSETTVTAIEGPETPYYTKVIYNWIEAGDPALKGTPEHPQNASNSASYFQAQASFFFDPLTVVMLCVVCGIGFLITVFSAGYMKGESGYFRFFAYLGLFIFMMTCLVMGGNLIMLYLGWEGVGLCSYLLIGYYYEKPAAREAAKKAFLVNRIGDFGFGIGIMLCYLAFGTVSYFGDGVGTNTGLLELANGTLTATQANYLYWIPFCLMLGAFGKSAQFPLYVWLPDAMEGPTPVSALIHAATMVTAGVYMIARCGSLFVHNPAAMTTIAVIGCFTALLAATIALRQFDLKKVFAYSTISQLGFMFVGIGALAPVAGVFHLITHAFFKALLFLSSGVVMHAMAGELDMRKMSGLKAILPKTRKLMLIGCIALSGLPFIASGFYSKDDIVGAAFHKSFLLGAMLLVAAFMTAYYTFRLYFRVFEGQLVVPEAPADAHGHGHESHEHAAASHSAVTTGTAPASGVDTGQTHHDPHAHHDHEPNIMIYPLMVLAAGALLAGFINWPFDFLGDFLGKSPSFIAAFDAVHANPALVNGDLTAQAFGQAGAGESHLAKFLLMIVSGAIALLGVGVAYVLHLMDRDLADTLVHEERLKPIVRILDHKYWVDEVYQRLIVENLRTLGKLFAFVIDRFIVDGLVNLAGMIPQAGGVFLKITVQRGYLQGYAAAMLFGIAIILFVIFVH